MMTQQKPWILLAEASVQSTDETLRALSENFAPPAVVVARDGMEMWDCLHRRNGFRKRPDGQPALVLLDPRFPVDGWEVLQRVRADEKFKVIPVIVFTRSRSPVDLRRAYELGANAFVVKPSEFRKLTACLDHVLAFWLRINEPPLPMEDITTPDQGVFAHAA